MVAEGVKASAVPIRNILLNHILTVFLTSPTHDTHQCPSARADGNLKRLQRPPAQHPELPVDCGKINRGLIRSHRVPQFVTPEFSFDITSNT